MALLPRPPTGGESTGLGSLYGPDETTPSYFASKQPWAGEAGTLGSRGNTRTFPTLFDQVWCHSGSTEMVEHALRVVQERAAKELPF